MGDFLWFAAACLVVLGAMWLSFALALKGSVADPHDIEDLY